MISKLYVFVSFIALMPISKDGYFVVFGGSHGSPPHKGIEKGYGVYYCVLTTALRCIAHVCHT